MIIQAPPPSGDWSGNADTAALQSAIDAAHRATQQYCGASVLQLSSQHSYWINKPLQFGKVADPTRVVLRGSGVSRIEWRGPRTSDYMLRIYGHGYGAEDVLRDVSLWCNKNSRGVLCSYSTYRCSLQSVYIRDAVESALDLVDCWGQSLRDVFVLDCDGFALRTRSANACHFDSFYVHGGKGVTWPSATDTYCVGKDGVPYRTASEDRAAIHFWGNGSMLTNLGCERCEYGDYPLWHSGRETQCIRVNTWRLESNRGTKHFVVLDGCRDVKFSDVAATEYLAQERDCFMRLKGVTRGIRLNRFWGWSGIKPTGNLILLDGGDHAGVICTECATADAYVPESQWIGQINGASLKPWDDVFNSNPQPIHMVPPIPLAE